MSGQRVLKAQTMVDGERYRRSERKGAISGSVGGSWNLMRVPAFLCYFFFPLLAEEDSSRAAHARASIEERSPPPCSSLIPAGPLLRSPSILLLLAS